ncbi:short-chain dehydrogenase [Colletotrichum tofieldiae]|nr:short-chain dehydrogenase [Colletotrichum tofieldiae]
MTGAKVFITGRDLAKGERVAKDISSANPLYPPVEVIEMDHNSLQSVRDGAAEFLSRSGGKLNVLMANAGIMGCPYGKTRTDSRRSSL